jgi:hypothetical protein
MAGEISDILSDLFSTHVATILPSQDYVLTETTKFRFAMNLETFQSIPAQRMDKKVEKPGNCW